jgi:hypothetical protein
MLNKQPRTAGKRWSSSLGVNKLLRNIAKVSDLESLDKRPKLRTMDMRSDTWNARYLVGHVRS